MIDLSSYLMKQCTNHVFFLCNLILLSLQPHALKATLSVVFSLIFQDEIDVYAVVCLFPHTLKDFLMSLHHLSFADFFASTVSTTKHTC